MSEPLDGGVPAIQIDGAPGDAVGLEYKDSLLPGIPWQPWTDVPVIGWSATTLDLNAPTSGQRFYRAQVP